MRNKKGGRVNSELNNFEFENRNNRNTNLAVPITKILSASKKYSAREKKLKNMKWGMGLEHEVQYFYVPINENTNKKYPLNEVVLFNSLEPLVRLLNESKLITESDRYLLTKLDYEKTGRTCHGKTILEKTPIAMPEFITEKPFSDLSNPRNITNYYNELKEKEYRFEKIMRKDPIVNNFIDKNFLLIQYPFGMCSNIRIRKDYNGINYELDKKHYKDYCGSFHYTITLPFEGNDEEKFRNMHYNFGAMFQWIEPLLLAAYFSSDQDALGTTKKRIRGSFRVARVGWGNFAGSDMRKKTTGVGRYADVLPHWRKDFEFNESDIVDECIKPNPKLKELQAVSSFSSNIRTFGPTDPNNPRNRISGAPMKIPNGMEIRIFDHFPTANLLSLLQIIILIAANSMTTTVKDFVYEDKEWINTLQKIMLYGWKYEVSPLFIKKIENIYNINSIKIKSYRAYDVLVAVVDELFNKNKDSDIVYMMYGKVTKPTIPQINKYSWDFAFMLKIVGDKKIYQKYLLFIEKMIENNEVKVFKELVVKIFGNEWNNNAEDILWFFVGKKLLKLNKEETKYMIDKQLLKGFLKLDDINVEIFTQLNIEKFFNHEKINNKLDKNLDFLKKDNVLDRFKNYLDLSQMEKKIIENNIIR